MQIKLRQRIESKRKETVNLLLAAFVGVLALQGTLRADDPALQPVAFKPNQVLKHSLNAEELKDTNGLAKKTPRFKPVAYTLRPNDIIKVDLRNEPEEPVEQQTIDAQGMIDVPHLNWVQIAGMTIEEAEAYLISEYKEGYYVDPQIRIRLIEKAKMQFKILGQVANPGFYEVPPGMDLDLLDAIAIAGGYTRIASKIILKSEANEKGEVDINTFKLRDLTRGTKVKIPKLAGNETIVVGESIF